MAQSSMSGWQSARIIVVGYLRLNSGVTAEFNSLRITNGATTGTGGGIYNAGYPTLYNIFLFNNSADQYGGAVYNGGTLTVMYSKIESNSALMGGGAV